MFPLKRIPVSLWFIIIICFWNVWSFISHSYWDYSFTIFLTLLFSTLMRVALIVGIFKRYSWTWKFGIASGIYEILVAIYMHFASAGIKAIMLAALQSVPKGGEKIDPDQLKLFTDVLINISLYYTIASGLLFVLIFYFKRRFFSESSYLISLPYRVGDSLECKKCKNTFSFGPSTIDCPFCKNPL